MVIGWILIFDVGTLLSIETSLLSTSQAFTLEKRTALNTVEVGKGREEARRGREGKKNFAFPFLSLLLLFL